MSERFLRLDLKQWRAEQKAVDKMKDGDILAFKTGWPKEYVSGYHIAIRNMQANDYDDVSWAIRHFGGDALIKKVDGVFYIEEFHREQTLYKALEAAQKYKQPYVLQLKDNRLIWLK